MRPASIVHFERLYLAAIVISLVTTFLLWNQTLAMLQVQPGIQFGHGFLAVVTTGGLLIQLLLWYFIARQPSLVAKWIFVVLLGLALLGLILNFLSGAVLTDVPVLLGIVAFLLRLAAAWMLFRSDAKIWFGEDVPTAELP